MDRAIDDRNTGNLCSLSMCYSSKRIVQRIELVRIYHAVVSLVNIWEELGEKMERKSRKVFEA